MKRIAEVMFNQLFATSLPIRLHFRNDLHLARKVWHMSMGLVIAFIYMSGMALSTALTILCSVLALAVVVESVRLRSPLFNERVVRFWGPFMRTSEVDRMSGVVYYLSATVLAIAVFPRPVAVLAILYLACGDPLASVFGILYGKHGVRLANGKSLIGTAAGVVTCALVTFLFLKSLALPGAHLWLLTAIGGLAGGTAELAPFEIDDNFTIPVISGFTLWLAFIVLGI
jgi:diacylglycerol kinase (CTP)